MGATFAYSANGDFNGKDYPFVGAGTRNDSDIVSWGRARLPSMPSWRRPVLRQRHEPCGFQRFQGTDDQWERNGSEWTRDTWSQSQQEAIKGLAHPPSDMRCQPAW